MIMDLTATLTDDCLLELFSKLPLQPDRLTTLPLVCRRWAQLQPAVRKAVHSLTLVTADNSEVNLRRFQSPFYLVEGEVTTNRRDLLRLLPSSDTLDAATANAAQTVERLLAELPNIRKLTIVHLNYNFVKEYPRSELLLSVVEHYAGQLTSFAFHCSCIHVNDRFSMRYLLKKAVSAVHQRLLTLINYKMPQLRHLLLNIELDLFGGAQNIDVPGSLYLPVLRQLHSFSARIAEHNSLDDMLLGSLVRFGAKNDNLKVVRLADTYFSVQALWMADVVRGKLDYLTTAQFHRGIPAYSSLANIRYLHLKPYQGERLLPLFTDIAGSFPRLSTLALDWAALAEIDEPEYLPPLPSVTRLELTWNFVLKEEDRFGVDAIIQVKDVFPSLRHLSIGHYTRNGQNVIFHSDHLEQVCNLGNLRRVLWPLDLSPLKNFTDLPHIVVNCNGRQLHVDLDHL